MKVKFANLQSWLLLRGLFERQYIIPVQPPKLLEQFLIWFERQMMNVDITNIRIDRPIFIIALPRVGSSMTQNIICAHPNISYISNTMHQFRRCFCAAEDLRRRFNLNAEGERYLGDSVIIDTRTPSDAVAFWGEWFKEDFYSLDYVDRKIEDFSSDEIERIKGIIRKMIWCFGSDGRADRFFTKNPGLISRILLLKDIFPDAKFIHIVRDPRMVANSLIKLYKSDHAQLIKIRSKMRHGVYDDKPFIPYPRLPNLAENIKKYGPEDIRTTAHIWNDAVSFINERKEQLPSFYEIRYEDILANPKEMIFKIFEFCELPQISEDNTEFWQKISQVGVIHHKNIYGNFEIVEEICHNNMQRYGY